jgi:hypothetical protein
MVIVFLLFYNCSFSQGTVKLNEVIIEVKSKTTDEPVNSARVEIKGYEETLTDKTGKAWFPEVAKGNYQIEVDANGYENYIHPFLFKVTGEDDNLSINLKPLPDNTFSIRGRVIDAQFESHLDSVEVFVKIGILEKTTYTNDWGFFNFLFKEDEIKNNKEFNLNIRKNGYELNSSYVGGFYSNHIETPTFKLEKKTKLIKDETIKTTTVKRKSQKSTIPLTTISISPESNFFLSNNDLQVQGTSSFAIRWNLTRKRKKITIGAGWHLPINIKTQNTFETLDGQVSEVETNYRINNLGFLSFRYYANSKNNLKYRPFFGVTTLLEKQTPTPSIISSENHQEEKESYVKIVPRITGGISIKRGLLWIEPFVSATYFNMDSQNFIFNYFGRADSLPVKESFFQASIGINLELTFIRQ